jgi:hypothetical protein
MDPEILAALQPVIDSFEAFAVPYQVGGSVASSAYGAARSTLDVDVVAALRPEHAVPLVERLKDNYYIDLQRVSQAVAHQGSFNVIHLSTMIKVDVFLPKDRAFDRESLKRRRLEPIEEGPSASSLYLTSPEDVILYKLEWYRSGGEASERQWADVLGVIKVQADALEGAYLLFWAKALGVEDLLRRAFNEAGRSPGHEESRSR